MRFFFFFLHTVPDVIDVRGRARLRIPQPENYRHHDNSRRGRENPPNGKDAAAVVRVRIIFGKHLLRSGIGIFWRAERPVRIPLLNRLGGAVAHRRIMAQMYRYTIVSIFDIFSVSISSMFMIGARLLKYRQHLFYIFISLTLLRREKSYSLWWRLLRTWNSLGKFLKCNCRHRTPEARP